MEQYQAEYNLFILLVVLILAIFLIIIILSWIAFDSEYEKLIEALLINY